MELTWNARQLIVKYVSGNVQVGFIKTKTVTIKNSIGNDDDTNCNGRFCPRGTGGVGMYYDEDRLKTPLMRVVGDDGKQTYKEVSWDEAFDFIADRMQKIKVEHGPECTALFTHGSGGHYWGALLKAFGSTNIAALRMHNAAVRAKLRLLPLLGKVWIHRNPPISAIPAALF